MGGAGRSCWGLSRLGWAGRTGLADEGDRRWGSSEELQAIEVCFGGWRRQASESQTGKLVFDEVNREPLEIDTLMIFYAESVETIGEYFWLLGSLY